MNRVRLQALFDDAPLARRAVARLVEAGVPPAAIELRSATPQPSLPGAGGRSWIPLAALVGGCLGALAGVSIASLTALDRPLVTGGMPIVAPFPVGIIAYEATALGAILATVARAVYEAGLRPRRTPVGPLDAQLAAGGVLVEVVTADPALGRSCLGDARRLALVPEERPGS